MIIILSENFSLYNRIFCNSLCHKYECFKNKEFLSGHFTSTVQNSFLYFPGELSGHFDVILLNEVGGCKYDMAAPKKLCVQTC